MSKRSGGAATAESAARGARFMTIECSRSEHSIVFRMARGNVREKATVEPTINISTNYVGVDKWEASN